MTSHIKKSIIKFLDSIITLLAIDGLTIVFLAFLILTSLIHTHIVVKSFILLLLSLAYIYLLVKFNNLK
jgi:hypothetical protein